MEIKSSCRSQFLVIEKEVTDMLQQGYSKKALYDYFKNQGKITMVYNSWLVVLRYQTKNKPFGLAQKKSNPEPFTTESKNAKKKETINQNSRTIRGKFHHSNDPYPTEDVTDSIIAKKEDEKPFNIIRKKH